MADGDGQQTEVPMAMSVDIGLFNENPDNVTEGEDHVLLFEKHEISSGRNSFKFTVDQRPSHAGIDPYNKLIDRNTDDNLDSVDDA